jgi:hypothetical protein
MSARELFPKFRLKKDWYIEVDILGVKNKTLIFTEGQVFESESDNNYYIIYGGWSEETRNVGGRLILDEEKMRLANDGVELLFEVIDDIPDLELMVEELPDDDDILVRNWRIQLDVKTTRKKLKEIEIIINKVVKPIL